MSERAQALEAALRALRNECHAIKSMSYDEIKASAGYTNLKCWMDRMDEVDALLAVPPPPPVGSPTTPDMGQGWFVTAGRWGDSIVTIEEKSLSGKPDFTPEDQALVRGAALHLLAFIGQPTPVEPAGASEPPRQHYVDVPPNRRVVGVFSDGSYMIEHGDGQREHVYVRRSAKGYQAGASPVAPEPPTEERQMTHRDTLGNEFGPAPRDPFWSAPTGAPAPCVWRETRDHGLTVYTPICRPECVTDTPLVTEYVVCPHCKAPLTVER